MIDIWGVVANGPWVVGLAVLLATLSWAHWAAGVEDVRFRETLGRTEVRRIMDVGLALFCAGLAATSDVWWRQVLWGLLAAAWVVDAGATLGDSSTRCSRSE